ncbi:sugar-binding transcriptional regulator [Canibacter zhoujuaniae]|uniref:sugar-binding transcriptional regulator n=1 Tax=Canibacter zhoujuaniae TaxID=2708343 RepID=UPI0014201C64|nr:sugar-binding domain-containing protein [Canibacter zhoujuaniae]
MVRGNENLRIKDALFAAKLYYEKNEKMAAIARALGTSRSTVSRLLAYAREQGLVEIQIHAPTGDRSRLEERLNKKFDVLATVVPASSRVNELERLDRTARVAAKAVAAAIDSRLTVGVAWGATLSAITRHLPTKDVFDVNVVQMNGAANVRTSGVSYTGSIFGKFAQAFGASLHQFPVPALFDDPRTKEAMWRERSVRSVLDLQQRAGLFVFGLGSPKAGLPSHVFADEYLDGADREQIKTEAIVGDCATTFYRVDGSTDGIALNQRSSGPSFEQIRSIPSRLCVVASPTKRYSLLGALRAGLITELVVDEQCARAVLAER